MQAHTHTHRDTLGPAVGLERSVGGDGRRDCFLRSLKDGKELIGAAVDLVAARLRYGAPEQAPVLAQDGAVAIPELLHEPSRPLDVREEQSHGPARQLRHVDLPASRLDPFWPRYPLASARA
jgi:hypothetical protein